jgi:hypothetical protein
MLSADASWQGATPYLQTLGALLGVVGAVLTIVQQVRASRSKRHEDEGLRRAAPSADGTPPVSHHGSGSGSPDTGMNLGQAGQPPPRRRFSHAADRARRLCRRLLINR